MSGRNFDAVHGFIREDAILPDEEEFLRAAHEDRERGDILSHEEVWA